ncbi:MAG: hypothetical protein PWQ75_702 [Methanolobus sp.]|uniref:flippase n=1 Tax=Methanolobus sp. TaxID=1874737 RepID=UPI00258BC813|nr:flippase [Methanolobus sp.]MDK2830950.1 hypothetical protein [Methanolobus sp.]
MSLTGKIVQNVGFLFAGRLAVKIFSLISTILIARYLGEIGFGKYSFAFAFVSFFTIFSELGLVQIVVREGARHPEKLRSFLSNCLFLKLVLSILSFIIATILVILMGYPSGTILTVQIAAFILIIDSFNVYRAIYEVNLEMKYSVIFYSLSRLIQLLLIYLAISHDLGLYWIVFVTVLANLIHNLFMYLHSRKTVAVNIKYNSHCCKFLLKESLPLALSSVFVIIYYRVDVVMLSFMTGDAAVGLYSAAYRFSESFTLIPNVVMISVFPLMSKYFNKDNSSFSFLYERSVKYLVFLSLPIAILTTFYSDIIIYYIYGSDFAASSVTLKILIWATAFIFINYSNGQLFVAINKQRFTLIYTGFGVIINILMNSFLIPLYSYNGAAFATLLTEFFVAIVAFFFARSSINIVSLVKNNVYSILSGIFMVGVLDFTVDTHPFIAMVVSTLIYLGFFYFIGGFDSFDKSLISHVFKKGN